MRYYKLQAIIGLGTMFVAGWIFVLTLSDKQVSPIIWALGLTLVMACLLMMFQEHKSKFQNVDLVEDGSTEEENDQRA